MGSDFSVRHSKMTRGNRHKLEILEGKFLTVRVVKRWSRLHRGVVESPSLEILKTSLNMAPSHLLKLPCFEQEADGL